MSKKVLIVDDSDASRDSLRFGLLQKGFTVLLAKDGEEALVMLANEASLDLIITDINMPGISGLELVKRVRAMAPFKFTPIIVLSSDPEEIKKSAEAGASAWIAKSSKMSEQLNEVIKKLIP
jgi:two-component system chemotaxis response regulator CheY